MPASLLFGIALLAAVVHGVDVSWQHTASEDVMIRYCGMQMRFSHTPEDAKLSGHQVGEDITELSTQSMHSLAFIHYFRVAELPPLSALSETLPATASLLL